MSLQRSASHSPECRLGSSAAAVPPAIVVQASCLLVLEFNQVHRWSAFTWCSCLTLLAVVVLCVGLCLLRNTWCEQQEEEEKLGLARLCCASQSSLPSSVSTKLAHHRLLLRAFVIILPATLWRTVFMLEII
eukprot:1124687-Pelagomonas_calceolata.AAC.1